MREIALLPKTFPLTALAQAEQLIGLSDVVRTVAEGNPEQAAAATAWLQELQAADAEDRFFFMLLGIIAVGRKLA